MLFGSMKIYVDDIGCYICPQPEPLFRGVSENGLSGNRVAVFGLRPDRSRVLPSVLAHGQDRGVAGFG